MAGVAFNFDLTEGDFEYFRKLVLQLTGIHLALGKKDLIKSRLRSRLEHYGFNDFAKYRAFLAGLPQEDPEWQEFINQITTNKTEFFRERAHFNMLQESFLPKWVARNPQKGAKLNVWSAACSTGEEPYSLAMVFERFFEGRSSFDILASDIDTTVLLLGANGVYPMSRLSEIPSEYHQKALVKGTGQVSGWFKIRSELKDSIRFAQVNLTAFQPLSQVKGIYHQHHFDVIFCRNVFLYFKPETIEKICGYFANILNPGGILVLGHAESLGVQSTLWKSLGSSVYQKIGSEKPTALILEVAHREFPSKLREHPLDSLHPSSLIHPGAKRLQVPRKKVLIVDDSATMRQLLAGALSKSDELVVVGSVGDPRDLAAAIKKFDPDVITLDLKMPHMDGCEVLERVLVNYSIPTLIISAVTMSEGPDVMRALELGAADYMEKPTFESLKSGESGLIDRVLQTAGTKVRRLQKRKTAAKTTILAKKKGLYKFHTQLILIGASTGGIQAITEVLTQLPASIPPILIVQHIPAVFSKAFASRMDQICPFHVKEAQDGDLVVQDQVLIAPGNKHMTILPDGLQGLKVSLSDGPPVNRHRPSVDVLFESAVACGLGPQVVGVILTGMGGDGAAGLKTLKNHGAQTIAQDEASSAVFGMPREAIRLNAADMVCSLEKIAGQIEIFLSSQSAKTIQNTKPALAKPLKSAS